MVPAPGTTVQQRSVAWVRWAAPPWSNALDRLTLPLRGKPKIPNEKTLSGNGQAALKSRGGTWESINQVLQQVLGGRMRLAALQNKSIFGISNLGEPHVALVNPHAKVNDDIFFLRGCSTPVTLRRVEPEPGQKQATYTVVGGAWLYIEGSRLSRYRAWVHGKGDSLEYDDISVLRLV